MAPDHHAQPPPATPSWQTALSQLIDEYTIALGVGKRALAQALGVGTDLSPSGFSGPNHVAWFNRLCGCFTAAQLPRVAIELRLAPAKYRVLEDFFRNAVRVLQGWHIEPPYARNLRQQSLDFGMIGVELFDAGRWDIASSYLDPAWLSFQSQPAQADDDLALWVKLRVGTQLISLDGHLGQTRRTSSILNDLMRTSRTILHSRATASKLVAINAWFLKKVSPVGKIEESFAVVM